MRCFVIQPFDGGEFDKRYAEVYRPSIEKSGYSPYRVDEDPAASIPIDEIEKGIRLADAVFADISLDNPNVWFELGLAIAHVKEVCIVCSSERARFPFDVQHRNIIRYSIKNISDFMELGEKITKRLKIISKRSENISIISNRLVKEPTPVSGLSLFERIAISVIASNSFDDIDLMNIYQYRGECEKQGYNALASNLALKRLNSMGFVVIERKMDMNGDVVSLISLSSAGWEWLQNNSAEFNLKNTRKTRPKKENLLDLEDEIPF
jgi:hypothetical protein